MSLKVSNIIRKLIFTGSLLGAVSAQAQQDSLFLSVEQLFESGIKNSLQLQSDSLKERMTYERKLYAKTGLLPDLEIGLKGGIIGQPVVFQNGLSNPTYPDTPDWSQNYTVDFNQPLYQGGKIRRSIQKADIETEIARLQRMTNQADIKLGLLNQYLTLFTLFKQHLVLTRNIEESERRLQDIRQMKKEGLITNNDVLRSEMQLTNDRLSLQETENSIHIVSQQLNLLLGNDRNPIITPDTASASYSAGQLRRLPPVSLRAGTRHATATQGNRTGPEPDRDRPCLTQAEHQSVCVEHPGPPHHAYHDRLIQQ